MVGCVFRKLDDGEYNLLSGLNLGDVSLSEESWEVDLISADYCFYDLWKVVEERLRPIEFLLQFYLNKLFYFRYLFLLNYSKNRSDPIGKVVICPKRMNRVNPWSLMGWSTIFSS